jgi:hypothetical protein
MGSAVTTAQAHGNDNLGNDNLGEDNLDRAGAFDALAESKRRTWEVFFRWLMIGGLLGALSLVTLLAFIYSRYP